MMLTVLRLRQGVPYAPCIAPAEETAAKQNHCLAAPFGCSVAERNSQQGSTLLPRQHVQCRRPTAR
jgi:hypothetical protein